MRTLYRATRVYSLSSPAVGEWILIDERHVQRVGSGTPPEADRLVELPGATIVPGFIDTHVHLTPTGRALADTDVYGARSREELLAVAKRRVGETPADEPVILQGYDETLWDDPRPPSIEDLDELAQRPLVIHRTDGHMALANSAAIAAADIAAEPGTERAADGEPTGRITLEAVHRLDRWETERLSDNDVQELQLRAAALAASRGITCVHEMSMPHEFGIRDLQVFLRQRERLPIDCVPIVATMDIPQVIDLGLGTIGGDLPVDGSIGARTAALAAPYADGSAFGIAYYDDDELERFFGDGHGAGLQVGVHAIGDRAIEQVLTAWERVYQALDSRQRRHFRARRHRVEHFEMTSAGQVERAGMLGLAVSVQPTFDRLWGGAGGLYEIGLGEDRSGSMNPFRTMLERGVELGVGSDAPVTPLDPMLTLMALEGHHDPAQRMSRFEAIRLHTIGSARLAHHEEKKGALGPGMHADFAAFEVDPFEAETLETVRPILTVSLGREVFAA
ncbi:MAG: amidohydrolase family protein [Actinomycetota bacterium]|nr:amidohydrolase family protein [Actinomycetota bacterium]